MVRDPSLLQACSLPETQVSLVPILNPIALISMLTQSYETRQRVLDKVEGDGGTVQTIRRSFSPSICHLYLSNALSPRLHPIQPGACSPLQMAMCFCARFGPRGVKFAFLFLGSVPSGATEEKADGDAWVCQINNGAESALGRAIARNHKRTALYILDNAPKLVPRGRFWRDRGLTTRELIRDWCVGRFI